MITDINEFEFKYVFAPGRLERRQHCFIITGVDGTDAQEVWICGYGASQQKALKDLKEETVSAGFDSDLMPSLYHRWINSQDAARQIAVGYLGNINGPGCDPDVI